MHVNIGYDSKLVADYLLSCSRVNPVTPMQLLKLVYICHGWTLGLMGRPLIRENAEAWKYGPVVPKIYHRFKEYRASAISEIPSEAPTGFEVDELSIMNQVWNHYGGFSGPQLSALTHKPGSPWDLTVQLSGVGSVISNDLIEEHYRALSKTGQS